MKKIIIILFTCFCLTGCLSQEDNFDDVLTYTTLYPIEYATSYLYSDYSKVSSIYPNEINIEDYTLTKKQKEKYALGKTFVYSGIANEAPIAKDFLNINNNLQIIDAMKGMNYKYSVEELWLDPSNYLMLCRNIKSSLIDYTNNAYEIKNINELYEKLKASISELDVSLYNLSKNGNYNSIVVSNNVFNYLNKYGINVISLQGDQDGVDKAYSSAKGLIDNKTIKYIYVKKGETLDSTLTKFIEENKLEKIEISMIDVLTNDEKKNNETYITLMKNIIDEYKKELYK